jgi:hypothetical protein
MKTEPGDHTEIVRLNKEKRKLIYKVVIRYCTDVDEALDFL